MKRLILFIFSFFLAIGIHAQSWAPKDIGVGIYNQTQYDQVLNILQTGNNWSQKELLNAGYFNNQAIKFGTWVSGPATNTFTNKNGVPAYMIKFVITFPSGGNQSYGPYGFYQPGFMTQFLNIGADKLGKWKIEYFLVNRETNETRLIGTKEFTITE